MLIILTAVNWIKFNNHNKDNCIISAEVNADAIIAIVMMKVDLVVLAVYHKEALQKVFNKTVPNKFLIRFYKDQLMMTASIIREN